MVRPEARPMRAGRYSWASTSAMLMLAFMVDPDNDDHRHHCAVSQTGQHSDGRHQHELGNEQHQAPAEARAARTAEQGADRGGAQQHAVIMLPAAAGRASHVREEQGR